MSANSAHEALKAEMARSQAELAQAQSAHKQETVEMQLEKERLEAEVSWPFDAILVDAQAAGAVWRNRSCWGG